MNTTPNLDFSALDDAQIPAIYFARAAGISRLTVGRWLAQWRGGEPVHMRSLYRMHASSVLKAVATAVEAGDLPLIGKPTYVAFKAALEKHLAN